jgi:hypothetical protein
MSYGVIGRHWLPRIGYAGTYDQQWLDEHFPFLPPDFDEQYYQAAPLDQQLPKPLGEQMVSLVNLTPDGISCRLHRSAWPWWRPRRGRRASN